MATTTRSRLRTMFARATGFYFSGTNTGTADNTVVDANIPRYDTGRLRDLWVLITSGTRSGESRRISSVTSSTATLVTALSGVLANGDTFEILPYDPDIMNEALQEATRTVWPKRVNGRAMRGLYLPTTDETLIADNLLLNPSLDINTTGPVAFTNWVNIGTPTLATSTTRRVHGTQSASVAATGATEGIEQDILAILDIDQIVGKTLRVRGWVWASVASAVRLRVTQDGTTFTNGPWHVGDDEWEGPSIHRIDHPITANATEMTVSCEVTDTNTGYFDLLAAWVNPISEYTMPTAFYPNGPARVFVQADEDRPEGSYVPVGSTYPAAGRVLRLEGAARLTVPTTDTGTTEVDENEAEFLIAEAAVFLFNRLAMMYPELRSEYRIEEQKWQAKSDERRESVGHSLPSAHERVGWHTSSEASRIFYLGRY